MAFLVSTLLLRSRLHSQAASPGSWSTSYSGLRQMYNGASVVLSIAGLIYLLQAPGYRRGIALIQSATRTSARSLMARGLGFVDEPIQRLHDTSGFISGARSIGAGLAGNFEKPQCYPFVLNTTSVIVYRQGSLFGILTPMHLESRTSRLWRSSPFCPRSIVAALQTFQGCQCGYAFENGIFGAVWSLHPLRVCRVFYLTFEFATTSKIIQGLPPAMLYIRFRKQSDVPHS